MQSSFLMGMIGLMIFIGDLVSQKMGPKFFGFYFLGVLVLVGYLIILAMLDALATASHTKAALARLRAQRRQLERQAAELKERPLTAE